MLKYFLIELMTPIVCLLIFYFVYSFAMTKMNKRGWIWGAIFTILSFPIMAYAWMHAGRYSKELQCVVAYGDISLNPEICNNVDQGINALIQTPMLLTVWVAMSAFVVIRLRPRNLN